MEKETKQESCVCVCECACVCICWVRGVCVYLQAYVCLKEKCECARDKTK